MFHKRDPIFGDEQDLILLQQHKRAQVKLINEILYEDDNLSDSREEIIDDYALDYNKIQFIPHQSVCLYPMTELQLAYSYYDKYPLFVYRKAIWIFWKYSQHNARQFTSNSLFQIFMLLIITSNSLCMALEINLLNTFYLSIYTAEFILKLIGQGIIMRKNAYFKELWNIFDFLILVSAYATIYTELSLNLDSLRTLRILHNLMGVESIKPMHNILVSLFQSISQLKDAVIVLIFSYSIFAIIGLILFSGILKYRCINQELGIYMNKEICTQCQAGFLCAKTLNNPNQGLISFDTFGWAILQVFITTTMEGWSTIMFYVVQALNFFVVIYFIAIVILGGFFLVNLTLAIIKLNFSNTNQPTIAKTEENKFDYWQLRELGIYTPNRPPYLPSYGVTQEAQVPMKIKRKKKRTVLNTRRMGTILVPQSAKKQLLQVKPIIGARHYSKEFQIATHKNVKFNGIFGLGQSEQPKSRSTIRQQSHKTVVDQEFNILHDLSVQRSMKSISIQKSITNQKSLKSNSKSKEKESNEQSEKQTTNPNAFRRVSGQRYTTQLQVPEFNAGPTFMKDTLQQHSYKVHPLKPIKQKEELFDISSENSFQNSMNSQEIYKKLEEIDAVKEIEFSQKNQKSAKNIQNKYQRKKRKLKTFRPVSSSVEESQQKLKTKLFMTKFSVLVKYDNYKSSSEMDVLEKQILAKKVLQDKQHEAIIRQVNAKIQYQLLEQDSANNSASISQITEKTFKSYKSHISQTKRFRNSKVKKKKNYLDYQKKMRKVLDKDNEIQDIYGKIEVNLEESEIFHLDEFQIVTRSSIFYNQYQQIIQKQLNTHHLVAQASIQDVLPSHIDYYYSESYKKYQLIISSLNNYSKTIWIAGIKGIVGSIQRKLIYFIQSSTFTRIINFCVAFNTIILALDGLVTNDTILQEFNLAFTIIFTIELCLKVLANGPYQYLQDKLNIFDAIIVAISLYEISVVDVNGKSSFTVLRSIRVFRALRVLRISKLIRSLQFMGFLMKVLSNAFENIICLVLLMLFFQYIFTLLGFELFNGELSSESNRANFNSFIGSYEIVFQVFTLSNWNNVLYSLLLSQSPQYTSITYLIIWIALGNYVFLNLFLAVLLDTFEIEYRLDKKQIDTNIVIAKDKLFEEDSESSKQSKRSTRNSVQLLELEINPTEKVFIYFTEYGLAERSLLIFGQNNLLRIVCYRIVKDLKFEILVLFLIFLSSLKLVVDTYNINIDITVESDQIDLALVVMFALEAIMKIIAFGLIVDESSYLRNPWNSLDFFILIVSILDVSLIQVDLGFLKILRLFRTLRPLRFITHYSSMKILVSALLQSVEGIFNVGIVIILTWMMFAIIGINFTKGKMNYCNMGDGVTYYITQEECLGSWEVRDTNFENIFTGMLTLFILSTLVAWPDYLLYFKDGSDNGPVLNYNPEMFWFFATFILIGSILLINLFIGVILVNFHIAEEKSRDPTLTAEQVFWMDTQKLIINSNPNFNIFYSPKNTIGQYMFMIVKFKYFESIVVLIIIANVIVTALYIDGKHIIKLDSSIKYVSNLDALNFVFSIFFMVESGMKIIAFSPVGYFKNYWNSFDFLIVLTSILDLSLNNYNQVLGKGFRVLRVARLLRLVNQFKGLKKVVDTAIFSIPAIFNAAILYFLFHSIFSILAVFLFQDVKKGIVIDEFVNFQDFHHSFVILFRSQTGEDWYKVMFDTMHSGSNYFALFWVIFIVIQKFVMLNLFILIILDQYDINFFHEDNPLNRFEENKNKFLNAWTQFSPDGETIAKQDLIKLMLILEEPLGYDVVNSTKKQIDEWKQINPNHSKDLLITLKRRIRADFIKNGCLKLMNMNLLCDEFGRIDFQQMMFSILRESVLTKLIVNLTIKGARKISKKERETKKQMKRQNELNYVFEVNPLKQYLYTQLCFKALLQYSTIVKVINNDNAFINDLDQSIEFDEADLNYRNSQKSLKFSEVDEIGYAQIPNTDVYEDQNVFVHESSPIIIDIQNFE